MKWSLWIWMPCWHSGTTRAHAHKLNSWHDTYLNKTFAVLIGFSYIFHHLILSLPVSPFCPQISVSNVPRHFICGYIYVAFYQSLWLLFNYLTTAYIFSQNAKTQSLINELIYLWVNIILTRICFPVQNRFFSSNNVSSLPQFAVFDNWGMLIWSS